MGPGLRRDDTEDVADCAVLNDGAVTLHATSDSFGIFATTDWLRPPALAA